MKSSSALGPAEHSFQTQVMAGAFQSSVRPGFLHVVTRQEVEELRQAIIRHSLPLDFDAKLMRLAGGNLTHRLVEHACRLFSALLLAAQDQRFEASEGDCERLLRVLAYVRKEDDMIADYKPNGFFDDQHEVRAAMADLAPLLKNFKQWRLVHQVPQMWANAA